MLVAAAAVAAIAVAGTAHFAVLFWVIAQGDRRGMGGRSVPTTMNDPKRLAAWELLRTKRPEVDKNDSPCARTTPIGRKRMTLGRFSDWR